MQFSYFSSYHALEGNKRLDVYINMGSRNSSPATPLARLSPPSLSENEDFCDDQPLRTHQTPPKPTIPPADIQVELTCCYPQVHISTAVQGLPCLLSLSCPGLEEGRGVDLVCVVDGSGSMRGKLDQLKSSLRLLVKKLTEKDRVALLSFNAYATYICPLTLCNSAGKSALYSGIDSLSAKGSLDLASGLHYGFQVLKSRRQRNPLSALFYLFSGTDERMGAALRFRAELALCGDMVCGGPVEMHVFGCGGEVAEVMAAIGTGRPGIGHLVGDLDGLTETFGKCLEGLKVTFADSIEVELQACGQAVLGQTYPSAQENTIKVSNLLANDQKDVVFTLKFPLNPQNLLPDSHFALISAKIAYRLIATDLMQTQEILLRIALVKEMEIAEIRVNETALVRFYLLKAEEILKRTKKLPEIGNFQSRFQLITDFLTEIQSSSVANNAQIAILRANFELSKAQISAELT